MINSSAISGISFNQANNATNFAGQPQSFYANVTNPVFVSNLTVGNDQANAIIYPTNLVMGLFTVNSGATQSQLVVGNAVVNTVINSTSMVMGTTTVNSTVISAGLNAAMTVSGFAVGNSSINTTINSVSISIGNTITNTFITTLNFIQGNSTMNTVIGQGVLTVGNLISVGNSLTNVVINSTAIAGVPVTSYQLNSTLAANVATMTANNAGYLGGTAASSYALLASPALTGTPTAPTAVSSTNTTQIATTAFVHAVASTAGNTSLAANGYTSLNGLIIQWGFGTTDGTGTLTGSFPKTFTSVCASLTTTAYLPSGYSPSVVISALSASSFSLFAYNLPGASAPYPSLPIYWMAIGW